ncbi:hypothetical protein BDZ97DRAFT_1650536 [Flammula alnicola]|nr:hypothetical protein BDZ97DRAFT_1650536 [Flammula alnicola]
MLDQANKLRQVSPIISSIPFIHLTNSFRQPIALFVTSADEMYGPITTLRRAGRLVKHIPWSAFKMTDQDWARVIDARDILRDSNHIQQYFSAEKQPTLWRALPALEELQSTWEKKRDSPRFDLYKNALTDGLEKLKKYYARLDEKPSFVLALVLHPYYKLAYIKLAWGGPEEQAAEIAAGNMDAKDWQDEARKIVERTVSNFVLAQCHT